MLCCCCVGISISQSITHICLQLVGSNRILERAFSSGSKGNSKERSGKLILTPLTADRSLSKFWQLVLCWQDFRSMASDESSDSSTSLDVEDDLQQSEDDCPLHDRIDNHRLAGPEDINLWTCGHGRVPRKKQPVKLCLTKSWLRKGLPIFV